MMEEEDIAPDPDTAIHYITTPHIEDMDLELDYGKYFALNTVRYGRVMSVASTSILCPH